MDEDLLTTLKLLIIGESGVGKSRFVGASSGELEASSKCCDVDRVFPVVM